MKTNPESYVHGRSERETERLHDQASGLAFLFHEGIRYSAGSTVLEAGCGVGAQTLHLAANNPRARFVSVDISPESLKQAKERTEAEGITNVTFQQADICSLPFPPASFDHVFVCFTLEHIPDPLHALTMLKKVLRPGGSLTVIEGDHGTAVFYPDSPAARRVIGCLITLQQQAAGNALIGRELEHLMEVTGYADIQITPLTTYASANIPGSTEALKNIFIAMIEGVREQAVAKGIVDPETWSRGIRDLYRTTEPGGMFCYTFFRATGTNR